jgi:hypothetical protein
MAALSFIFSALITNVLAQPDNCRQPALRTSDGRYDVCTNREKMSFTARSAAAPAIDFALKDRAGASLTPIGLLEHKHRGSVIVVFRESHECWELFFRADAPEIFEGFVHDYRSAEAIGESGPVRLRRMQLPRVATGVKITSLPYIIVETVAAPIWFNLDIRRETAPPVINGREPLAYP